MKAIVCEMCTSRDVVKDGDFYVCRNCGTKYTVENARKLMVEVEGTVDVSGSTVKIDGNAALENYLKLARQARQEGNAQNAAQYYELAKAMDGSNWESYFYSVYYHAASSRLMDMVSECNKISNCISNTVRLIGAGVPEDSRQAVCEELAGSVRSLRKAFVDTAYDHYMKFSQVNGAAGEYNQRCCAAYTMEYSAAVGIYDAFKYKDLCLGLLKDCSNVSVSHMQATEVSKAMAMIDPAAGLENMNKTTKKVIRNSIIYLVFAIGFIIFGLVFGSKGDSFKIVKIMGIVFGAGFGIWGIVGIISAIATKKNFENGKL